MDSNNLEDSDSSWESLEENYVMNPDDAAAKVLCIGSKHYNPHLALQCKDKKMDIEGSQKYYSVKQFKECVPDFKAEGKPPPPYVPPKRIRARRPPRPGPLPPNNNIKTKLNNFTTQSLHDTSSKETTKSTEVSTSSSKEHAVEVENVEVTPKSAEPYYPIPGRRFLPHQLPIKVDKRVHKNVLTLMDTYTGSLAALNEARLKHQRVKVWTRDKYGIRGYCYAFVESFDRHWNLIMKDVDEIFQRKRIIRDSNRTEDGDNSIAKKEDSFQERKDFESGKFLSTYSRRIKNRGRHSSSSSSMDRARGKSESRVRKGTQTGYLVEGPESALEICRIGIQNLLVSGMEKPKGMLKLGANEKEGNKDLAVISKASKRKKQLVILRDTKTDFVGNRITARSKYYEIVERHIDQMLLMGRYVIFVETNPQEIV